jgi:hypothetical protein
MVRYPEREEAIWDFDDRSEMLPRMSSTPPRWDRITAEAQARVADAEQTAATSIARADAGIRTAEHSADLARRRAEEDVAAAREEAARVRTDTALSAMSCAPLTARSPPACGPPWSAPSATRRRPRDRGHPAPGRGAAARRA